MPSNLLDFPVEIVSMHIMPMLSLKYFINIENAVVSRTPGDWCQAAPFNLETPLHSSAKFFTWIFNHGFLVNGIVNLIGSDQNSEQIFRLLSRNARSVRNLTLKITDWRPSKALLARCSQLQVGRFVDDKIMDWICEHAGNLTDLNIDATRDHTRTREAWVIRRIAAANPRLQSITLKSVSLDAGLVHAIKCAGRSLTSLELTVSELSTALLCEVVKGCPSLTNLDIRKHRTFITDLDSNGNLWNGSKEWLTVLAEACPELQYLSVPHTQKCGTHVLKQLFRHCRKLHTVLLPEAFARSTLLVRVAAAYKASLRRLLLSDAFKADVAPYRRLFHGVETVEMKTSFFAHNNIYASMAVSYMHNLQCLTVEILLTDNGDNFARLLDPVAVHCPQLSSLSCPARASCDAPLLLTLLCAPY